MRSITALFSLALFSLFLPPSILIEAVLAQTSNPIVFVTQVPKPDDFANIVSTFGNHRADLQAAPRGGDLWIRYEDGTLKNLTQAAGYGNNGLQGANSITVRDPAVHWDGNKVLFSMAVGAPAQYQYNDYRFQLYEISGLGRNQTPIITKVPGQPADYNNVMAVYTSDDDIIFASDLPRGKASHLYPQLDEYESTPTVTGLWHLDRGTGEVRMLDHSPSGDFHPIVDSYGRVLFIRWDHLQQDQQAETDTYGAFTYSDESPNAQELNTRREIFPEPRGEGRREQQNINLHTMNRFFPWMMNQDGSELETLNHIGRHELDEYFTQSFTNDGNLDEFIANRDRISANSYSVANLFHLREDPRQQGRYFATNGAEFFTHSAGQIVAINGAPSVNPEDMVVTPITAPETAVPSENPSSQHSGLYRNPLPISNGRLIAAHTSETRVDFNIGSRAFPRSRHRYRLKFVEQNGTYFRATTPLTGGINKSVSYYDPDVLVRYSGELWELQPVELIARVRPAVKHGSLPEIEQGVFASTGINIDAFQQYLADQNLALVVSRDVTTRDRADTQQPFRLSIGNSGGFGTYDISGIQFIQGDLVRGYRNFVGGRRVIGRTLHSVQVPTIFRNGNQPGGYKIESDGSFAALLPASRALSWQLTDAQDNAIVRERYWVTFQPGEIRVCASCHGINRRDQDGKSEPQNVPLALTKLLEEFQSNPDLSTPPSSGGGNGDNPATPDPEDPPGSGEGPHLPEPQLPAPPEDENNNEECGEGHVTFTVKKLRRGGRRAALMVRATADKSFSTEQRFVLKLLNRRKRVRRKKRFNLIPGEQKIFSLRISRRMFRQKLELQLYHNNQMIENQQL